LKVRCRFGVSVLPNFVLASGNEEDLLGTEASPFDGGATFLSQLGGRVWNFARNGFLAAETCPFKSGAYVVPQSVRSGTAQHA
jgi:hypothetical protein